MGEPEDITPQRQDFELEEDGLPDFSVKQQPTEAPSNLFTSEQRQADWDALEKEADEDLDDWEDLVENVAPINTTESESDQPEPGDQPRPVLLARALEGLGDTEPDVEQQPTEPGREGI